MAAQGKATNATAQPMAPCGLRTRNAAWTACNMPKIWTGNRRAPQMRNRMSRTIAAQ